MKYTVLPIRKIFRAASRVPFALCLGLVYVAFVSSPVSAAVHHTKSQAYCCSSSHTTSSHTTSSSHTTGTRSHTPSEDTNVEEEDGTVNRTSNRNTSSSYHYRYVPVHTSPGGTSSAGDQTWLLWLLLLGIILVVLWYINRGKFRSGE